MMFTGSLSPASYPLMKWTLFTALLLIAPALLFLVQVFMFIPVIFLAAGILFMIPKAVVTSHTMETLTFIGFFGVHLLIYAGMYLLISMVCAKLLFLIRNPITRNAAFAFVCLGVMSVTLFPVYGSGGHGPATWGSLFDLFQEVNSGYGPYTVVIVYGSYLVFISTLLVYRRHQRNRMTSGKIQRAN